MSSPQQSLGDSKEFFQGIFPGQTIIFNGNQITLYYLEFFPHFSPSLTVSVICVLMSCNFKIKSVILHCDLISRVQIITEKSGSKLPTESILKGQREIINGQTCLPWPSKIREIR